MWHVIGKRKQSMDQHKAIDASISMSNLRNRYSQLNYKICRNNKISILFLNTYMKSVALNLPGYIRVGNIMLNANYG